MAKDYKAMSLAYQPCNMPIQPIGEYKRKVKNSKESMSQKVISGFAKKNRRKMTGSELALHELLEEVLPRYGLVFVTQHVAGEYILDFAILKHRLAIEVDGEYHFFRGRQDGFRTKKLKKRGWTVLRFTNHDVNTDMPSVIRQILAACGTEFETASEE
jgi:very-short-patch-repair endonuclease